MSQARDDSLARILAALEASRLPEAETTPLREALLALYDDRPNAVDKVQAPLGRALRNPTFPGLWARCVDDIPGSDAYEPLRNAAHSIRAFVERSGR